MKLDTPTFPVTEQPAPAKATVRFKVRGQSVCRSGDRQHWETLHWLYNEKDACAFAWRASKQMHVADVVLVLQLREPSGEWSGNFEVPL